MMPIQAQPGYWQVKSASSMASLSIVTAVLSCVGDGFHPVVHCGLSVTVAGCGDRWVAGLARVHLQ